eukprot:2620581-Amphidinium_carterae.1
MGQSHTVSDRSLHAYYAQIQLCHYVLWKCARELNTERMTKWRSCSVMEAGQVWFCLMASGSL